MKIALCFWVISSVAFGSILDGVWKGRCEPVSQGFTQEQLTFKDNRYEMLMIHHKSGTCDDSNIRIESAGTFLLMEPNINYVSGATYMTPLNNGTALGMNVVGLCGIRNWKANQKVDVSGKTCDGEYIAQVGQTQYNIVEVDVNFLYAGQTTEIENGLSPDTRPTQFNRARRYELLP